MKDEFVTQIGVWGQRHYNYLKKHSPTVINVMRLKGTLEQYLTDMNRDTQETYDLLMCQYAEIEGVTENLKTADNLEWTITKSGASAPLFIYEYCTHFFELRF